jgi:hypothetical protein
MSSLPLLSTITEGQLFPTWDSLKYAIHSWAVLGAFTTYIYDKTPRVADYRCRRGRDLSCPWRVRAIIPRGYSEIRVTIVHPGHICHTAGGSSSAANSVDWLVERIPLHTTVTNTTPGPSLGEVIRVNYGVEVRPGQIERARERLNGSILDTHR